METVATTSAILTLMKKIKHTGSFSANQILGYSINCQTLKIGLCHETWVAKHTIVFCSTFWNVQHFNFCKLVPVIWRTKVTWKKKVEANPLSNWARWSLSSLSSGGTLQQTPKHHRMRGLNFSASMGTRVSFNSSDTKSEQTYAWTNVTSKTRRSVDSNRSLQRQTKSELDLKEDFSAKHRDIFSRVLSKMRRGTKCWMANHPLSLLLHVEWNLFEWVME